MPAKHSSVRTTVEWVAWAKSEGFVDIEEEDCTGNKAEGKVYCKLCSKWFGANSATIKQPCVEYKVGSKERLGSTWQKIAFQQLSLCKELINLLCCDSVS